MHTVLIMLTPGRGNKFMECQEYKVSIAVLRIENVKTGWIWTLEMLEWAFRLQDFASEWLQNPTYSLFTRQIEWTIV